MYKLFKNRFARSFFYAVAICVLIVFTVYEDPDFTKLSFDGTFETCTIGTPSAPESEMCASSADVLKGLGVLKEAVSKGIGTGKNASVNRQIILASSGIFFALICACAFLFFWFSETIITSRRFIITFIHDLDGMKP